MTELQTNNYKKEQRATAVVNRRQGIGLRGVQLNLETLGMIRS